MEIEGTVPENVKFSSKLSQTYSINAFRVTCLEKDAFYKSGNFRNAPSVIPSPLQLVASRSNSPS
jgi:hypothetical protein